MSFTTLTTEEAVLLGSLVAHIREYRSTEGHPFDLHAIDDLLRNAAIVGWLEKFPPGLLPEPRQGPPTHGNWGEPTVNP